jgi:hypothetical protein
MTKAIIANTADLVRSKMPTGSQPVGMVKTEFPFAYCQ